jgi:hypothetical protein
VPIGLKFAPLSEPRSRCSEKELLKSIIDFLVARRLHIVEGDVGSNKVADKISASVKLGWWNGSVSGRGDDSKKLKCRR